MEFYAEIEYIQHKARNYQPSLNAFQLPKYNSTILAGGNSALSPEKAEIISKIIRQKEELRKLEQIVKQEQIHSHRIKG